MSLKHTDLDSALRRLAERRIEEAMREGKFDNLRGAGQPLELEPMPANEDARMAWWAIRLLKQNDYTPDEVRWRKQLDRYREALDAATSEPRVRALVAAYNRLVTQINTLGTNALKAGVAPLSPERELEKFWTRLLPTTQSADPTPTPIPLAQPARLCRAENCGCPNPHTAAYCRRCGGPLVS